MSSHASIHEHHGADLRIGRWSEPGRAYVVTSVTRQRAAMFLNFWCARDVVLSIREVHDAGYFRCHAFVVMPDHVHLLFTLRYGLLSTVMRTFKSISARRINARRGRRGQVWQKGCHDHAIRNASTLRASARYIVANPLRAGLVTSLNHYPHWDTEWL